MGQCVSSSWPEDYRRVTLSVHSRESEREACRHFAGMTGALPGRTCLTIADHAALNIEIAHAMRVYASAGAVQLRFPTMASELIFAAAYPARVAIPIDPASVRHRNGQFGPRIFDRRKRSRFGRDWKHGDNADKQCRREKFFHRYDPRLCNGRCQSTRIVRAR